MTFPSLAGKIDSKIIYNGIDLEKIPFMERSKGYNIAWVAHISHKKNPAMILQVIKKLTEIDKHYKIHIAGDFQDSRYELYLKYMVEEMGLKNNVIFYGWVDDMEEWWRDKNYVLSTSIHEGHPYNIMEAMARGIKPVIHNFFGAKELYEKRWIFNDIEEACRIITENNYNSIYYRQYVTNRKWTFKDQINAVKKF
ncbi:MULTISPECIES: glycosyltransferase [unclassified Thermosipho (in: thermotogales)]|uniref:glycosyltransferase n=1 Tax=unclassified Thermosipho (in: thermotogales) TaxID=2676525 RepID=UPI00117F641E|nr:MULTISPECIES: glycosyltransferase [unclassified Thermosipho (in: thermotogales)]